MRRVKKPRRPGRTRISTKHQITIPIAALREAGLRAGHELRVEAAGPGRISLVHDQDILKQYAGALKGVYPPGYLERLRQEWR
jgi:bifunctional DNA-binding transcriptional regulator/antitoxin component of YhaV-PrlF toxin-antitoxin module